MTTGRDWKLTMALVLAASPARAGIFDTDMSGTARAGTPGALEAAGATGLDTCSTLGGVCCAAGEVCQGGGMAGASDCAQCCTGGGTCEPAASACDVTLSATWSADVDDSGLKGSWTSHSAGPQSVIYRVAVRFDLTSLPADQSVDAATLTFNVSYVSSGLETKTWSIGPYGGTGQGDPEADSGAVMYGLCDVSADAYVSATGDLRTTGEKSFTLPAVALADIDAARDAGTVFAVAVAMDDETGTDTFAGITAFDQAAAPSLHVTCTCTPVCASACGGEPDGCGGTCTHPASGSCGGDGGPAGGDAELSPDDNGGAAITPPRCGCVGTGEDAALLGAWLGALLVARRVRRQR